MLIAAPCGGRGVCGSCSVRVLEGELAPPDDLERRGLSAARDGVRLACRATVVAPVTVRPIVAQTMSASAGPGDTDETLVAAVDVGTTTVSAVIVGETTGRELGRATVPNAQLAFGGDVLSRLSAAVEGDAEALARVAVDTVLEALGGACGRAGACLAGIRRVVIAGNPAMLCLLVGSDPAGLTAAPFSVPPGISGGLCVPALAGRLAPGAEILAAPPLSPFVGGDVAAGLLAAGFVTDGGSGLFVDVGTNAEVVAVTPLGLTVASAAAGPAFEGFGLKDGGVWGPGAVGSVRLHDDDLVIEVGGGEEPDRIAGSGLLGAVAALRAAGHLDEGGLLTEKGPLERRLMDSDGIRALGIGPEGGPPVLTQLDIRAFQTAKAAVAAGIELVVGASRLKPRAIERLVLTGAFGGAVRSGDLVALGVVPADLEHAIEIVPDAALLGAAMLAFDPSLEGLLTALASGASHLELATDPGFMGAFIAHMAVAPYRLRRGLFG